jgi:hypothetical protein
MDSDAPKEFATPFTKEPADRDNENDVCPQFVPTSLMAGQELEDNIEFLAQEGAYWAWLKQTRIPDECDELQDALDMQTEMISPGGQLFEDMIDDSAIETCLYPLEGGDLQFELYQMQFLNDFQEALDGGLETANSGLGVNSDLIDLCEADIADDMQAILDFNDALTLQDYINAQLADACMVQEAALVE